jgi:ketose-bisphosphate aldolase
MYRTRTGGFAVGAFNVDDLATLRAVARAARAVHAPVIVELSGSEVAAIGLANARAVLDNEIDELGIEAYLNLDHAWNPDVISAALVAGFEFVHLDVFTGDAEASDDELVRATRRLVREASATGALVEGEPVRIGGVSTLHASAPAADVVASARTSAERVRWFADTTGVDLVAVGIGNVHGRYADHVALDLDLLHRIRASVNVDLTLHGGSGLSDATYRQVARAGVSKINVNSDLRVTARRALEGQLDSHPEEYAMSKLVGPVMRALQRLVEARLETFGAAGRARPEALR